MKNYILSETTYGEVKDTHVDLAILPWGATEAHNFHLPYSTDTIESEYIAAKAAGTATESGAKVMVLPSIPFGVNTGQKDIKFCMNINPSTQASLLNDLVTTLYAQGIRKLMILNGHGGNDFKPLLREIGSSFSGMILATANWFEAVEKDGFFEKQGEHADEMETSIMLSIAPELVRPLYEAGKGAARKFRVEALNQNWAWTERKWSEVTLDTGIGDPSLSSSSKGSRYLEAVIGKVAQLIIELCNVEQGDFYTARE